MRKNRQRIREDSGEREMPPTINEEDIVFDDLQQIFDEQRRRLNVLLERPEAQVRTLNYRVRHTLRRKMLYAWGVLVVCLVTGAICWAIVMSRYHYDSPMVILTYVLEGIIVVLIVDAVLAVRSVLCQDPGREGMDKMLRPGRGKGLLADLLSERQWGARVFIDRYRRAAVICLTTVCAFIMVSCATTIGDGHTLTQNHHARQESINVVNSIVNKI